MTIFEFSNALPVSTDGQMNAVTTQCTYHEDYAGESGILFIEEGGSIAFEEDRLHYNPISYTIKLRFLIDSMALGHLLLLKGTSIPLTVYLTCDDADMYSICTEMIIEGKVRRSKASIALQKEMWYDFVFVLLDGMYYCMVDDQVISRRVFQHTPKSLHETTNRTFFIGLSSTHSEVDTQGFTGYLSKVCFSDTVSEAYIQMGMNLSDKGYMEEESKYKDLAYEGIELGELTKAVTLLSEKSGVRYTTFSNGVILWSPAYSCVYMSLPIFAKYMKLYGDTLIGVPAEDEVYDTTLNLRYCLLQGGAFFQQGNTNNVWFIKALFMTKYYEEGMFESRYGVPQGEEESFNVIFPKEGSNDNEQMETTITLLRFTKRTMFYLTNEAGTTNVFSTDNILFDKYRNQYEEYGLIIGDEITGCVEVDSTSMLCKTYYYLPCCYKTLCMEERVIKRTRREEHPYKQFLSAMPSAIFDYFVVHNGINKELGFGDYKYPSSPAKTISNGITYQDFKKGVIVYYEEKKQVFGLQDWRVVLSRISAEEINDAINRVPELYIEVTLKHNTRAIETNQRWPKNKKHGGNDYKIINDAVKPSEQGKPALLYYDVQDIKGSDVIHFNVRVSDYDPESPNDFLGRYAFDFDIQTGWGLVEDYLKSEPVDNLRVDFSGTKDCSQAIYLGAYPIERGEDNRGGKTNIKFSFSLEGQKEPFQLDDYFRKYGYWPIYNFKPGLEISEECFNRVYGVQTGAWYDWILNTLDSIWYYIVRNEFSTKKGHCFGLSLEALDAVNGQSVYGLPLHNHILTSSHSETGNCGLNNGFCELIRQKHIYQAGWEHMKMIAKKVVDGIYLYPKNGFADIKKMIDRDKYCLIHLCDGEKKGGYHTVLGYKYFQRDGLVQKIFVADSNSPYIFTDPLKNDIKKDCSYICLEPGETFPKVLLKLDGDLVEKYAYVYGTPYAIVAKNPTVPSWWDIGTFILYINAGALIKFAISHLIGLFTMFVLGDAVVLESECDGSDEALEAFDIPSASEYYVTEGTSTKEVKGHSLKMMFGAATDTLRIKTKGTCVGVHRQVIISDNKVIMIEYAVSPNIVDEIMISRLKYPQPDITLKSGKPLTVTIKPFLVKYGKEATPHSKYNPKPSFKDYFINVMPQQNGDHEMHVKGCKRGPTEENARYLGAFKTEEDALIVAKQQFSRANGCYYCCPYTDTDRDRRVDTDKLKDVAVDDTSVSSSKGNDNEQTNTFGGGNVSVHTEQF